MKIVLATTNIHKLEEIRKMMPYGFKINSLSEIGYNKIIEETGSSFKENALIKARTVFEDTGYTCIADDSGLEVDALNGEPGIFSARYAGEKASSEQNTDKLKNEMKGIINRKCRYKVVIAYVSDNIEKTFEGTVEGKLSNELKGTNGFGYDPLFIPDGFQKTFGELPDETKARISHRANAVKLLVKFLQNLQ